MIRTQFLTRLRELIHAVAETDDLSLVAEHLALALREEGIPLQRLQLPLSQVFGLQHPFYVGIITTWSEETGRTVLYRERKANFLTPSLQVLAKSPYRGVVVDGLPMCRMHEGTPEWGAYPRLAELQQDGYLDYAVAAMELPDGARQVVSIASRQRNGFGPDLEERLLPLLYAAAPSLFAVYQMQMARQFAHVYLGPHTGARALSGQLARGDMEDIHALVAFMDLRNFTHTMNTLGSAQTLELINAAFQAVDEAVSPHGGEILKLIGDAALVVFRCEECVDLDSSAVLQACIDATERVAAATSVLGHPMVLGVGLHYGTVQYGNIGSEKRRDFTVIGPVVNLASRLEGLSKEQSALMIMSEEAAALRSDAGADISYAGEPCSFRRLDGVSIDGYDEPITVWTVSRPSAS